MLPKRGVPWQPHSDQLYLSIQLVVIVVMLLILSRFWATSLFPPRFFCHKIRIRISRRAHGTIMARLTWWNPDDEKHQMGVGKTLLVILVFVCLYKWVIPRLFPSVVEGRHTIVARGGNENREGAPVVEGARADMTVGAGGEVDGITLRGNMLSGGNHRHQPNRRGPATGTTAKNMPGNNA